MLQFKKKKQPATNVGVNKNQVPFTGMNVGNFSGYDRKKTSSIPLEKKMTRREINQANKLENERLGIKSARDYKKEARQTAKDFKKASKDAQKQNNPKKKSSSFGIDLSRKGKANYSTGASKFAQKRNKKVGTSPSCKAKMRGR